MSNPKLLKNKPLDNNNNNQFIQLPTILKSKQLEQCWISRLETVNNGVKTGQDTRPYIWWLIIVPSLHNTKEKGNNENQTPRLRTGRKP